MRLSQRLSSTSTAKTSHDVGPLLLLLVAIIWAQTLPATAAQVVPQCPSEENLLVNGDFETNSLAGWTSGGSGFSFVSNGVVRAQTGLLAQGFNTIVGVEYSVSVVYQRNDEESELELTIRDGSDMVVFPATVLPIFSTPGFVTFTTTFTSMDTTHTVILGWGLTNDAAEGFSEVDEVFVCDTTSPSSSPSSTPTSTPSSSPSSSTCRGARGARRALSNSDNNSRYCRYQRPRQRM